MISSRKQLPLAFIARRRSSFITPFHISKMSALKYKFLVASLDATKFYLESTYLENYRKHCDFEELFCKECDHKYKKKEKHDCVSQLKSTVRDLKKMNQEQMEAEVKSQLYYEGFFTNQQHYFESKFCIQEQEFQDKIEKQQQHYHEIINKQHPIRDKKINEALNLTKNDPTFNRERIFCKSCNKELCSIHPFNCSACHKEFSLELLTSCGVCNKEICKEHLDSCAQCDFRGCSDDYRDHLAQCSICKSFMCPRIYKKCTECKEMLCPNDTSNCA